MKIFFKFAYDYCCIKETFIHKIGSHCKLSSNQCRARRAHRVIKRSLVKRTGPNGRSHIINPTEINQALVSCHIFVRADQWIWNFGDQP